MTLAEYLKHSGIRLTDLAGQLDVKLTTLHGYVRRRRSPPVTVVARIEALTEGKVRAADLVPCEAGRAA